MTGMPGWSRPALLVAVTAFGPPAGLRGTQQEPNPPAGERPAPSPAPSETPIADSVDRVVERFIRERQCGTAGGVPCFPVSIEVQGRQYSVRETLDRLELDDRPLPGPPLPGEMIQHGANPRPPSASVGLDPKAILCKTRQLLRKIQGKSRRYHLYRVWDEAGERAVLRDRPIDPDLLASSPHFRYVPLGEFGDECEALKAYYRAAHDVRMRRGGEETEATHQPAPELRANPGPE